MLILEIEQTQTTVWERYRTTIYRCEHDAWKRVQEQYEDNERANTEVNIHITTTNAGEDNEELYVSSVEITHYECSDVWLSFHGYKDNLTEFAKELVAFSGTLTATVLTELASKHEVRQDCYAYVF